MVQAIDSAGRFGPTLAVYSAYESDFTGSYQLLLGRQVPDSTIVSSPVQLVSSPEGSYLVFPCVGELPEAVINGWRNVWTYFERQPVPPRAYTYDFELYHDGGPVEIWVALRAG